MGKQNEEEQWQQQQQQNNKEWQCQCTVIHHNKETTESQYVYN